MDVLFWGHCLYSKITTDMEKSQFEIRFFGRNPPCLPSRNDQKPAGTGCFNIREFRFTLDLRKDDVAWNLSTLVYHGLSPFGIQMCLVHLLGLEGHPV